MKPGQVLIPREVFGGPVRPAAVRWSSDLTDVGSIVRNLA